MLGVDSIVSELALRPGVSRLACRRAVFGGKSCPVRHAMEAPMETVPLGPGFAAELRGVTIDDVAAKRGRIRGGARGIRGASVLVLRDQDVTDEAQLALAPLRPVEVTEVAAEGHGTTS